jgi:hypothetical protein
LDTAGAVDKAALLLLALLALLEALQVVAITQRVVGVQAAAVVETVVLAGLEVLLLSILAELVLVRRFHIQELLFKSASAADHMVPQLAVDTYMYRGHNNRKRINAVLFKDR